MIELSCLTYKPRDSIKLPKMRGSLFSSELPRGGSISSVAFSGVDRTNNISRDNEDVMDNYMVSQDDVSALIMDEQEPS